MRIDMPRLLSAEDAKTLIGQMLTVRDPSPIEPGTVVHDSDTGEPVLAYTALKDPGPLRRALLRIEYPAGGVRRYNHYQSQSRTFGYAPRRPAMLRESCGIASLTTEHPDIERTLETYADQFSCTLKELLPDIVERDRVTLGGVLPQWRLGTEKLWTSGVVNDTAQLPYHRDGFNFPTWSAMPVVRRGTRGGYLHVPEYGLTVPCADATVVTFQGFKYVHGVTPIRRVKKHQGYRISVVYYALRGMKNCREAADEAAYGRARRTERETEMARRLAVGDTGIPGIKR